MSKSLSETLVEIVKQNEKGEIDYGGAIEQIDTAISEANKTLPIGNYSKLRTLQADAHYLIGALEMVRAGDEKSKPDAQLIERLRVDAAQLEQ
jgi:hypothetical protein